MGWYREHILPRIIDRSCNVSAAREDRRLVCAGLAGRVVEIGFGSGLNVPHYPAAVTAVVAVEPSDLAWRLARARVSASPVPVERAGLDGQSLPFPDASFDSALSTWSLCTIPDPVLALRELRRVLKPGGRFHFLEHGAALDARVRAWQARISPVQRPLAGGCDLTRRIADLLAGSDLTVTQLEEYYHPGRPKVLTAQTRGVATAG